MRKTATALSAAMVLALAAAPAMGNTSHKSYETDFSGVSIVNTADAPRHWRMTGAYDAEVSRTADPALRVSNATTSGSFGDQLFSPTLSVGAAEANEDNVFNARFTLLPTTLQEGLVVNVSPDDGNGARSAVLRISHDKDGINVESADWYIEDGTVKFKYEDVARGLDPTTSHTVSIQVVRKPSTEATDLNDVVRSWVDNGPKSEVASFEAYYRLGEKREMPDSDTLLFRVSGTPAPTLKGQGLAIDDVKLWVSTEIPATELQPPAVVQPPVVQPPVVQPPVVQPPAPAPAPKPVGVTAKSYANRSKLHVNVNPNKSPGYFNVQVQKRVNGKWVTLPKTYRTSGKYETVNVNLPKGTYRAKVTGKYGYAGATSNSVTLTR